MSKNPMLERRIPTILIGLCSNGDIAPGDIAVIEHTLQPHQEGMIERLTVPESLLPVEYYQLSVKVGTSELRKIVGGAMFGVPSVDLAALMQSAPVPAGATIVLAIQNCTPRAQKLRAAVALGPMPEPFLMTGPMWPGRRCR